MGNQGGKLVKRALNKVTKPIKDINIESRTEKVLSQPKPTPAPKYASTIRDIERTLEANPDIVEEIQRKNDELDKRLRHVYVSSHDEKIPDQKKINLPQDRTAVDYFEYGFKDPSHVARGRITLKQAIKLLNDHQVKPAESTVQKLAEEYKLDSKVVENIVSHFKLFRVHIPEESGKNVRIESNPFDKFQSEQIKLRDRFEEHKSKKDDEK